jgi:hypothetical protein
MNFLKRIPHNFVFTGQAQRSEPGIGIGCCSRPTGITTSTARAQACVSVTATGITVPVTSIISQFEAGDIGNISGGGFTADRGQCSHDGQCF